MIALNHCLAASVSVDHCMVQGPVRPVGMEIIANKSGAFAVDCIHQHLCVALVSTFRNQAPYFFFFGTVEKKPTSILSVAQKVLRSSSNDYAVAACGSVLDNPFGCLDNTVGIEGFYRAHT